MVENSPTAENMLVRLENLDRLLTVAGEVIIASSNLGLTYKNLQNLFEEGRPVGREILESTKDLAATASVISSDLHNLVQAIRTVDLKDLSFRARRLVRDVTRRTGKRVVFEIEGEETTIDKTIVEKLYDPISHQLRNAIDHGIEDPLERTRQGKPEEGRVVLRAYNTENETFIEIEDDGKGVDMEALRQKGIAAGKIDKDADFTEEDALEVMWMPGVSTANEVSEVSGRGVGMDVVHEQIIGMGGSVSFKTKEGKSSTFTFRVPLISAVNIIDALVVRSCRYFYAFPVSNVITTMSVPPEGVNSALGKGEVVRYLDSLLPLSSLNYIMNGTYTEENDDGHENISVLVIEHKEEMVALKISEFLSPQKLVIIPFNGTLEVEGLSGTTILGGKKLGFIADVPSMISRVKGRKTAKFQRKISEVEEVQKQILEEQREIPLKKKDAAVPAEKDDEKAALDEDTDASIREFVVEIEKLLPILNETLFSLEKDMENGDLINQAFRFFHTIKGNFIMIGLSKGGQTVHAVESVLDRARGNKTPLTPEIMDILMDGVSYIEEVVRNSKAGHWKDHPSENILEQSAKILPDAREGKNKVIDVSTAEVTLTHEASYRANYHRKRRIPFYRLYIEIESGKQPAFLVACLIYKRISEIGDVLGTVPPLKDLEKGVMDGKFKLLFASEVDADIMERSLTSLLTKHYGAKSVKFGRFE